MSPRRIDVEQLLADANPVPNPVPNATMAHHPLDARARADLAAILDGTRTPGAPAARRRPPATRSLVRRAVIGLAAAAAALTVFASGVVDLPGGEGAGRGAYAATPAQLRYRPLQGEATKVLTDIAARTARLPDDTGTGRYAMVSTSGWALWTEVDGERVTSAVVPQEVIEWRAQDGSGRKIVRSTEPGREETVQDQRTGPGELSGMWPLRSLSSDDQRLARQLQVGHPVMNGPAERLVAIGDAYRETPIPPAVRAAMLRYLAATPTLELQGSVTDRLGRPGVAVGLTDYSGLPTRHTLIVDPATGAVLGEEEMLTTSAGKLNVRVPSVISYTAYRESRYTDRLELE